MNKKYTYLIITAVVVVAVVAVLVFKKSESVNVLGVSPSPTSSLSSSPTMSPTSTIKPTTKPTPGIIIEENPSYYNLAVSFDKENRYFALAADCNSIKPSNVAFKNNTEIMLDNAASDKPRILKIGSREYSLEAYSWILATLSSSDLPAQLTIFCGSMELGQIGLE